MFGFGIRRRRLKTTSSYFPFKTHTLTHRIQRKLGARGNTGLFFFWHYQILMMLIRGGGCAHTHQGFVQNGALKIYFSPPSLPTVVISLFKHRRRRRSRGNNHNNSHPATTVVEQMVMVFSESHCHHWNNRGGTHLISSHSFFPQKMSVIFEHFIFWKIYSKITVSHT